MNGSMCITEQRVQEILKHEVQPMEDDLAGIRKILVWGLMGLVGCLFGVGVWVGTIQSNVSGIKEDQVRFEDRIEDRLVRIEALLISLSEKVSATH